VMSLSSGKWLPLPSPCSLCLCSVRWHAAFCTRFDQQNGGVAKAKSA
jgi:hypothetical protein